MWDEGVTTPATGQRGTGGGVSPQQGPYGCCLGEEGAEESETPSQEVGGSGRQTQAGPLPPAPIPNPMPPNHSGSWQGPGAAHALGRGVLISQRG